MNHKRLGSAYCKRYAPRGTSVNRKDCDKLISSMATGTIAHPEQVRKVIQAKMERVAVISAKNHKRQRRKRQSVTSKREKSQTPSFITAIQT